MLFLDAVAFITHAPGAWLHAALLVAGLQLAAMLAARRWQSLRRIPSSHTLTAGLRQAFARLALAAAALLLMRLAWLAAAIFLPANSAAALRLLPPLERGLIAAGTILLAWAMLFPERRQRADLAAAGLCAAVGLGLALNWAVWTPALAAAAFYNGSFTESLWTVANVALLAGGLWLVLARRPRDWPAGAAALALLLAGQAMHYLYPVAGADAPGPVRLAEMAAYPLALAMLYQRAMHWPLGAQAALLAEAPTGAAAPARRPRPAVLQMMEVALFTCVFFFAIEFATGRFRVDGPSMQPALVSGQYVLADKLAYRLGDPRRGDVAIITLPPSDPVGRPRELIKRVIGLPGETITIEHGAVSINGWHYPELYLLEAPAYSGAWTLGQGEYFLLGDNRNDSADSHVLGPIRRDRFVGKALLVYWPLRSWVLVAHAHGR